MRRVHLVLVLSAFVCAGAVVTGANGQNDSAIACAPEALVETPAQEIEMSDRDAGFDNFPLPFIPPGACELPDGDCVVTLDTICRILGGEFQGANTECE